MGSPLDIKQVNGLTIKWLEENKNKVDHTAFFHYLQKWRGCFPWQENYTWDYAKFVAIEFEAAKRKVLEAEDKESMREYFKTQMSTLASRFEEQMIDWMFGSLKSDEFRAFVSSD